MRTLKVVLVFSVVLCGMTAYAQSVAEAAKAKPAKKATRVITNDEIPSRPQEDPKPGSGAASGGSSSAAADEKPAAKADAEAAPSTQGSPEVQELEKQLADLNRNIVARQKRTEAYREKMNNETDEHRKEVEQEVLTAMEADIQAMQKESEDLQKKIDEKKSADKEKPKETEGPKESGNQ